jgi:hypothetical protein
MERKPSLLYGPILDGPVLADVLRIERLGLAPFVEAGTVAAHSTRCPGHECTRPTGSAFVWPSSVMRCFASMPASRTKGRTSVSPSA